MKGNLRIFKIYGGGGRKQEDARNR